MQTQGLCPERLRPERLNMPCARLQSRLGRIRPLSERVQELYDAGRIESAAAFSPSRSVALLSRSESWPMLQTLSCCIPATQMFSWAMTSEDFSNTPPYLHLRISNHPFPAKSSSTLVTSSTAGSDASFICMSPDVRIMVPTTPHCRDQLWKLKFVA